MKKLNRSEARLVVCLDNEGYGVSLEKRKIYFAIPDEAASKHGLIRVIDESGEDYLYSKSLFHPINLPRPLRKVILEVA